jgi:hypothetical protein
MAGLLNEDWWYQECLLQRRQKTTSDEVPERQYSGWASVSSDRV